MVFRVVWGFHRRTAEGSPKRRRKRILADINARPPDEREIGNCRDRIATHSGRDGAGGEKKEKAPQEKKPPTKKEKPLLAAPLAYGRLRRPLAILSYTMKSRLSETHMGIGIPLSPDCENQRFSCQGLLRLSLSEACFVTVTCHELICSPLDFASARHPKGPLS